MNNFLLSFLHGATFLVWLCLLRVFLSLRQILVNILLVSGNRRRKSWLVIPSFMYIFIHQPTLIGHGFDRSESKTVERLMNGAAAWERFKQTNRPWINHSKLAANYSELQLGQSLQCSGLNCSLLSSVLFLPNWLIRAGHTWVASGLRGHKNVIQTAEQREAECFQFVCTKKKKFISVVH